MATRRMLLATILITAVTLIHPAAAQLAVGFRAGADYATMHYGEPKPFEVESSAGSHVGAFGSLGLSDMVGLQLEVARSVRGFGIGGSGYDGTVQMTYLEFPLLAVLSLPPAGRVAARLLAGFAVSREVACNFDMMIGGAPANTDCDAPEHQFEDRRTVDLGLRFGGGVGVRFGAWKTFGDVLFDLGMRDIDGDVGATQTAHSRTWMFTAGVAYAIDLW